MTTRKKTSVRSVKSSKKPTAKLTAQNPATSTAKRPSPAKTKNQKNPPPAAGSRFRWRTIDLTVALVTMLLIFFGVWASLNQEKDPLACEKPGTDHQVVVSGETFTPNQLTLQRCDRLIVINKGEQTYELTFGTHENLGSYPGFSQQVLRPSEYFELDALQAGIYTLHDHLHNKAYLELRITDKPT